MRFWTIALAIAVSGSALSPAHAQAAQAGFAALLELDG